MIVTTDLMNTSSSYAADVPDLPGIEGPMFSSNAKRHFLSRLAVLGSAACLVSSIVSATDAVGTARPAQIVDSGSMTTSVFVFHKGSLVGSSCTGAPSYRVAMREAYPDIARHAYPLRRNVRNGITATVQSRELPSADSGGGTPIRLITQVMQVGESVACDVQSVDRPLLGTRWTEIQGDSVREHGWTFRFDAATVRVSDGCNGGSSVYHYDGRQLTFRRFMQTMLACKWQTYDRPGIDRSPPLDQDWLEFGVPYALTIKGRILELGSASRPHRTFIANEWD